MFAGIIRFDSRSLGGREEDRLTALISRRVPGPAVRRFAHGVFVGGEGSQPGFTSLSRLDNRAEIASALGLGSSADESSCIRESFQRRGDAGLAPLLGSFVLAHWDGQQRVLTLARDYLGYGFALFYHRGDGFVAFATHLADLLAMPDVPRELDERAMANFLALNHREVQTTFYRGIYRVPSRGVVRIGPQDNSLRYYWSPKLDAPPPYTRPEDYIERARELFDRAVARTLKDTSRAAIHLSGGFDSSAVAATAMRLGGIDLTGFTGVPPAGLRRPGRPGWYMDETGKIRALAALYPELKTCLITPRGAHISQTDPVRGFLDVPLAIRGICNLGWFGQIDDAIEAQGHKIVLHGGMGNMTLSWDGGFSLSELLSARRYGDLFHEARAVARQSGRSLPRVLMGDAIMPLLPRAAQQGIMRLFGRKPLDVSEFSLLNPQVIEDLDLKAQWRADGFDPAYRKQGTSAALRTHQIFNQLQLSRDMAAMVRLSKGVSYRDPYSDRELIEFCLTVPDTVYRRGGVPRWFARQVFAGRLPPEILNETLRGEQAPNWFESLDERRPRMLAEMERIEASSLASRLLDIPRMKRLFEEWPKDAAEAEPRSGEFRYGLDRAVHAGQFIRWVEGGNG